MPKTKKKQKEKATPIELPIASFGEIEDWSAWLASHHRSSRGIWIKIARKASGRASITYAEALEVALAWGWIDGQKGKLAEDDAWWLQKFTPRSARSMWSTINREKATALIAAGKMTPSGVAEVERAKKDGRWDRAYESQSRASVPRISKGRSRRVPAPRNSSPPSTRGTATPFSSA